MKQDRVIELAQLLERRKELEADKQTWSTAIISFNHRESSGMPPTTVYTPLFGIRTGSTGYEAIKQIAINALSSEINKIDEEIALA